MLKPTEQAGLAQAVREGQSSLRGERWRRAGGGASVPNSEQEAE